MLDTYAQPVAEGEFSIEETHIQQRYVQAQTGFVADSKIGCWTPEWDGNVWRTRWMHWERKFRN
jgi:hypothetical protein